MGNKTHRLPVRPFPGARSRNFNVSFARISSIDGDISKKLKQ